MENDFNIRNILDKSIKHHDSSVTFEQLWSKYSNQKSKKRPFNPKRKVAYIGIVTMLLLVVIPVSAAILPIDWNGIKISILDDNGENARVDSFKELVFGPNPTYKESIEDSLKQAKYMKRTLSLEEAIKEFPFPILRPQQTTVTPLKSIGALMNHTLQEQGNQEKVIEYNYVFHDFYEQDKQWIVVTQSLDSQATDYLQGKVDSMSETYIGKWESVNMNDQTIALFADGNKENRLLLRYQTDDNKVIDLKLYGNVSKEELVRFAESYITKN